MAFISFFRKVAPQRFKYIPQFYDPDNEAIQERMEDLKNLDNQSPEAVKRRVAKAFARRKAGGGAIKTRERSRSNRTLFIVLIAIVVFVFIFITQYLPQMVKSIEGSWAQ